MTRIFGRPLDLTIGRRHFRGWALDLGSRTYHRDYGFAFLVNGGTSGSTYGEPGQNASAEIVLTVIAWTLSLRIAWKETES